MTTAAAQVQCPGAVTGPGPAGPRVAVLLPAYNEALAIGAVIEAFRAALPEATIYVYDNNSRDATAEIARAAGAVVRSERRQGKGYVVRRMFADVDADIYLMCDADATYEAAAAPAMVERLLRDGLDMVVATRSAVSETAYRPAHAFGNRMLTGIVRVIFGNVFTDMLSGYRVFSRRFVKSFPITSQGFEIETELTIHALELQMPVDEVRARFTDRPAGSTSKLNTVRDGLRILRTIVGLLRLERPFQLFGWIGALFMALSVLAGWPVVTEFLRTGLVPRLPTAVLATGLMLIGWLSVFSGLILDSVTRARQEVKRLRYLELAGVHALAAPDPLAAAAAAPR
ncbi:glycosyltransferase family 2 protein [Novosphingobium huizhouense]|uniref:glycosyltransferase family 2 protein n=1 Tax=Novosphingobium huizhouense TaxID=2866625 RepID=UPI001CD85761|nr:glycosyltransferase family 2 protein [Novosphingobium huizhouense]